MAQTILSTLCSFVLVFSLNNFVIGYRSPLHRVLPPRLSTVLSSGPVPISPKTEISNSLQKAKYGAMFVFNQLLVTKLMKTENANAIGSLYEFQNQSMVIQDISLNVQDASKDAAMMRALFIEACKEVRTYKEGDENVSIMGFGADAMASPATFTPGVSNFMEDGGHATITFRSKKESAEETVEVFVPGNGLQYIKIGASDIKLSKAMDKGGVVNYGYGWVDIDTPGSIPLEVVVGYRFRDNVMLTALRVSDLKKSVEFMTRELGMKLLPFPLARTTGSDYEKVQDKGSIYLGYSDSSMGILLLPPPPTPKRGMSPVAPLVIGSQFNGFTIVVDDSANRSSDSPPLPPPVQEFVDSKATGTKTLYSPDGYPFILKKFSAFDKVATKLVL